MKDKAKTSNGEPYFWGGTSPWEETYSGERIPSRAWRVPLRTASNLLLPKSKKEEYTFTLLLAVRSAFESWVEKAELESWGKKAMPLNTSKLSLDEAAEAVRATLEELLEKKLGTKGRFLGLVESVEGDSYAFYYEIPLEAYLKFDDLSEIGVEVLKRSRELGHSFTFHPIPDRDA